MAKELHAPPWASERFGFRWGAWVGSFLRTDPVIIFLASHRYHESNFWEILPDQADDVIVGIFPTVSQMP